MSLSLGDRPPIDVGPMPVPKLLHPALAYPRGTLYWPLLATEGNKPLLEGHQHRWVGPLCTRGSGLITHPSDPGACGQDSLWRDWGPGATSFPAASVAPSPGPPLAERWSPQPPSC